MVNTIARIKKAGLHFEIVVDLDEAVKFKKGEISNFEPLTDHIFKDSKKGEIASKEDLVKVFGNSDVLEISKIIVKEGEVQLNQEYRDEEKEKRFKQVVDFLSKNAVDPQTKNPLTSERIKNAINQANVNLKNVPIENQINEILDQISKIIPIKLETKRIKIVIPSMYTAKVYGLFNQYKEKENWLNDGSLEVIIKMPSGLIMGFYDKLNSITHGSAITQEMKNE